MWNWARQQTEVGADHLLGSQSGPSQGATAHGAALALLHLLYCRVRKCLVKEPTLVTSTRCVLPCFVLHLLTLILCSNPKHVSSGWAPSHWVTFTARALTGHELQVCPCHTPQREPGSKGSACLGKEEQQQLAKIISISNTCRWIVSQVIMAWEFLKCLKASCNLLQAVFPAVRHLFVVFCKWRERVAVCFCLGIHLSPMGKTPWWCRAARGGEPPHPRLLFENGTCTGCWWWWEVSRPPCSHWEIPLPSLFRRDRVSKPTNGHFCLGGLVEISLGLSWTLPFLVARDDANTQAEIVGSPWELLGSCSPASAHLENNKITGWAG